jgi:segregation and condensation protein B
VEAVDGGGTAVAKNGGTRKRSSHGLSRAQLKAALESLIFVSDKPVAPAHLAKVVRVTASEVRGVVEELVDEYRGRGLELIQFGGGYAFRSAPANAAFVRDFLAQRPVRLTRAQLETLAIVSYRQPTTRPEVEEIRGVDTGSALHVLLDRGLLKILGRKDEPGRPLLYGTTPYFLEFFGLKSLKDLPTLREFSELSEESRDLYARKIGNLPEQDGEPGSGEAEDPESRFSAEGEAGGPENRGPEDGGGGSDADGSEAATSEAGEGREPEEDAATGAVDEMNESGQ